MPEDLSDIAQHLAGEPLTLRDMQAFHRALDQAKHFDLDLIRNIAYLAGELGEVVQAARRWQREQQTPAADQAAEHLGCELADCLAYLLKLANYAGIDLEAAYVSKMRYNLSRTWHTKSDQEVT